MSSITTINASDTITSSRSVINTNFANLNTDKIETSVIDTDTTLAANSDAKVPSQKAIKAYVDNQSGATSVLSKIKFGGTGADGALTITSGTTTISCGGAQVLVKNYTSISITGTGKLAFSNPHANGTIIILKSQGDVTITSSTVPAVDVSGMGASGGTAGSNGVPATAGTNGTVPQPMIVSGLTGGGLGVASASGGTAGAAGAVSSPTVSTAYASILDWRPILIGAAGGGGGYGSNTSTGGVGGRGGGSLVIQCGGAYNVTSTLTAAGGVGGDGVSNGSPNQGPGGGGGGGGGSLIAFYGSLTANSGTYTVTGGAGGAGQAGTGSGTGGGGGGGGGSNTAGTIGTAGSGSGVGGGGGAGGTGLSLVAANTQFV